MEIKIGQNWISSRISEGTFRPPGNLLLRLILRHFRYEIRWCFAVSDVFRKKCLATGFLLLLEAAAAAMKIGDQIGQNWISSRIPSEEPVRKLGDVLLFRLCFEKGVWLLVSCFIRGSSSNQN